MMTITWTSRRVHGFAELKRSLCWPPRCGRGHWRPGHCRGWRYSEGPRPAYEELLRVCLWRVAGCLATIFFEGKNMGGHGG